MSAFPFDIVGFDLDGTLVDSSGDITAAVNHALADIGRGPLSTEEVKLLVGAGTRELMAKVLAATGGYTPEQLEGLTARMLAFYTANVAVHTRAFDGVIDAIDALAARGVKVAVVTNKLERLAVQVLDQLGILDRFAAVIGGDTAAAPKPSPAPVLAMIERCGGGRAAFIGDSHFDVEAARAAGLPTVVVSFGFLTAPIEELGADVVIDSYAELVPALERLGAQGR